MLVLRQSSDAKAMMLILFKAILNIGFGVNIAALVICDTRHLLKILLMCVQLCESLSELYSRAMAR